MAKKPSNKTKSLVKALGIKQEQPENLKGLAAKGAGKETRFQPGDERTKHNRGQQLQIVPPNTFATQRKRLNELVKEFQHMPLAKELASAMGIDGEATLVEAVTMALFLAAIRGDINAVKLIQAITEPDREKPLPENAPMLKMKVVRASSPETKPEEGEVPALPPAPEPEPKPRPPFADDQGEEQ